MCAGPGHGMSFVVRATAPEPEGYDGISGAFLPKPRRKTCKAAHATSPRDAAEASAVGTAKAWRHMWRNRVHNIKRRLVENNAP
mmetsp:Transcript_22820/g.65854  ORF Transcript_22820/g.65854 Transcript_22820/m.65854 type:complete len:84 (+) Transcript_22820:310-561(+)